jgi:DNA-binding transcriptional LysR family regulator
MTLEQVRIFVAVAERQHLTEGARAVHLTPSAATAAIQALEQRHGVRLFHRVGRRLELSEGGRAFLPEARRILATVASAELALRELNGLTRGHLSIAASQTLANYWLPPLLTRFAIAHPGLEVSVRDGNTETVAAAVLAGDAEMGCIEGDLDEPALAVATLAEDRLVVIGAPGHPLAGVLGVAPTDLEACRWVLREPGSGTRAVLEASLRTAGLRPESLATVLCLSSNEAVCAAVAASDCLSAVSELVARQHLESGRLRRIDYGLAPRRFSIVVHKERFRSKAALAFERVLRDEAEALRKWQREPDYQI